MPLPGKRLANNVPMLRQNVIAKRGVVPGVPGEVYRAPTLLLEALPETRVSPARQDCAAPSPHQIFIQRSMSSSELLSMSYPRKRIIGISPLNRHNLLLAV